MMPCLTQQDFISKNGVKLPHNTLDIEAHILGMAGVPGEKTQRNPRVQVCFSADELRRIDRIGQRLKIKKRTAMVYRWAMLGLEAEEKKRPC